MVQTLLVRDEIDLIADHLDFHLAHGVDLIIATDNGSVDGTRDVLADYARGGRVVVIDEPPADFSQHRWVTRMARMAHARYAADWVIHADADEFFVARAGSLADTLAAVPATPNALTIARQDFVVVADAVEAPGPRTMRYRNVDSRNDQGRALPRKVLHRGVAGVTVGQGNHHVGFPGKRQRRFGGITVLHYPLRSYAQFASKVRNAGSGYAINTTLPSNAGRHKRRWYALLQQGQLRAEYERLCVSGAALDQGLADGVYVEDTRVRDALRALRG